MFVLIQLPSPLALRNFFLNTPTPAAKPKPAPKRQDEETLPHPQIENLKKLRDEGILTDEQFEAARKKVLAKT